MGKEPLGQPKPMGVALYNGGTWYRVCDDQLQILKDDPRKVDLPLRIKERCDPEAIFLGGSFIDVAPKSEMDEWWEALPEYVKILV